MSGRRSNHRVAPAHPWEGSFRLLREVAITGRGPTGLTALSQAPGVVGERMTLDLGGGGLLTSVEVTVATSRPVVHEGELKHELLLEFVPGEGTR
jgi:hypothetical protein